MKHLTLFKKLISISTLISLLFLMRCSGRESTANTAAPLRPEMLLPFRSPEITYNGFPNLVNCEGESLSENASPTDPLNTYSKIVKAGDFNENQILVLSSKDPSLESVIQKVDESYQVRLTDTETKKNLFLISQYPFNGFINGSFFGDTSMGWIHCEGDQKVFKDFIGRPKNCQARWVDEEQKDQLLNFNLRGFITPMTLIAENDLFDLKYTVTRYFISLQIFKADTDIELASATTDRFYQKAHFEFSLGPLQLTFDCQQENR